MTASAAQLTDRRVARGGIALVATSQYLIAEQVVASSWTAAPYSFGDNYISDLGVPECTVLDRVVCSPQFFVMDAAFVLQGLLVLIAVWQLAWLLPRGWRVASAALGIVHALGLVLVGAFPGSVAEDIGGDPVRAALHTAGAVLAIGGGLVWMLVTALPVVRRWRGWGIASLAGAVVGLAAVAVSPFTTLGLGVGGIERVMVYPIIGWLIVSGIALVAAHRGALQRERFAAERAEDAAAVAAAEGAAGAVRGEASSATRAPGDASASTADRGRDDRGIGDGGGGANAGPDAGIEVGRSTDPGRE